MHKRILSVVLSIILVLGMFTFVPQISEKSTIKANAITATSQENIVKRADSLYGCKWTSMKSIGSWRSNSTFTKGKQYRLPYGQPVTAGKYVCFAISALDWMKATRSASNVYYTSRSYYSGNSGSYAPYYANDCSAFVSYCWDTTRKTTAYLPGVSTSLGKVTTANVQKLQLGDAFNYNGSGAHVVLVTDLIKDASGKITNIEITEQTPPQLKRTTYTVANLVSKYSSYTILRYNGTVSAPTFNINYNANGGEGTMNTQTITYGTATNLTKNTFTRLGYTFLGWHVYRNSMGTWVYQNSSGDSGWYASGSQPSGYSLKLYSDEISVSKTGYGIGDTVTMYAVWAQQVGEDGTFIFQFDANGGTGTMEPQTVTHGTDTAISANIFTNEGYSFKGWKAYRTASNKYLFTNGTTSDWYVDGEEPAGYYPYLYTDQQVVADTGLGTGDVVILTAVWGKHNYTVRYDANGGVGTMADSQHIYGVESTLSANTFTKEGHTFAGWYFYKPDSGERLYSQKANSADSTWSLPGTQDAGWHVSLYGDQRIVSKLGHSEGEVVYAIAQWTPNTTGTTSFYVDFEANGGTGTMERQKIVTGTVTSLTKNAFTYENHDFLGWIAYRRSDNKWKCKDANGNSVWTLATDITDSTEFVLYKDENGVHSTSTVDCDVVSYYAVWDFIEHFIFEFDPNGGTGTMADQKVVYGQVTTINRNQFTREGYTFKGWNAYRVGDNEWAYTSPDGSSKGFYVEGEQPAGLTELVVYNDGNSVSKTGNGTGDVVRLYAVWDANTYNIAYDSNGGSGNMKGISLKYDTSLELNANSFKKADSKFNGWIAKRASDNAVYCVSKTDSNDKKWLTESEISTSYEKYVFDQNETVSKLTGVNGDTVTFSVNWRLLGDSNNDGTLTIDDATNIQYVLAKLVTAEENVEEFCDVDGDGEMSIKDVTYIQMYLAKYITTFPTE